MGVTNYHDAQLAAPLAAPKELDYPTRALPEEAVSESQATLAQQPAEIEPQSLTERSWESAKAIVH